MGDRICIMREGRMIQVGKPLEVYADPVDTFVARFLATPPMNLVPARLEGRGDGLVVTGDGFTVEVPEMHRAAYAPLAGREVIFGLRPEDLLEAPQPGFAPVEVGVVAMEALGVENILVGQIGTGAAAGGPAEISARLSRHFTAPVGARVPLYLDPRPMHLFDPETTRAFPRPSLRLVKS